MDNLFDLTGRVAVVTGASSGLGADAARAYAGQGADVALLARRVEKLKTVADEIAATGRKVLVVGCDVTDEEQVRKAIGQVVARFGKIDILLNNAGVAVPGTVEQLTTDEWDKEMNTNVRGAYLVCKYVVPHMRERRYGKIVNISSVNALIADKSPLLARHVYNASKAAVLGLTIGMAASYGVDGITVNAVCPGLFESEMTEDTLFKNEEFMRMYNFTDPMSRPGRRGELNGTILYFSSDASSYVTGQHVVVDGGAKVQNPPPVQVFGQKCYFGMKKSVFSAAYPCCYSRPCSRVMTIAFGLSAVYPVAGKDALRVVMFDFPHFGHQVGRVDKFLRGITSRDDDFYRRMAAVQGIQYGVDRQQSEMQGDGQFVEDDYVVFAALQQGGAAGQTVACHPDIDRFGILADKTSPTQLFDLHLVEELPDFRFVVSHRLDELSDVNAFAGAQSSHGQSERGRRLAFAVSGIDVNISFR